MKIGLKALGIIGVVLVALGGSIGGCSCRGAELVIDPTPGDAQGSSGETSSGGGGSQSLLAGVGSGGAGGIVECASTEASAEAINKPVDIVFIIDNSDSMSGEIREVEEQINVNFASIIDVAKPPIDYRVIMVSRFGEAVEQRICVSAPLSGTPDQDADGHCDEVPSEPQNTSKFYHHSAYISSFNALCRLHQQFSTSDRFDLQPNGYHEVLRPGAFKIFVAITDDRVGTDQPSNCLSPAYDDQDTISGGEAVARQWDADMLALSPIHFGTAGARNYIFHSIIAITPFDPNDLTLAHPPTAPIVTGRCRPGAQHVGTGYQALSVLTGGLRYPTCGLDYTTIFREIAAGVIDVAKVPCEFEIPEPPLGDTLDLSTVVVAYTPGGGGATEVFRQVDQGAACELGRFYMERGKILLCPSTCALVQSDDAAEIAIRFGCDPDIVQ